MRDNLQYQKKELFENREIGLSNFNDLINQASSQIILHPVDYELGIETLEALNLPSGNMFGALLLNTGGIVIDQGLRILGSPKDKTIRNILGWNSEKGTLKNGLLLFADDIYGGFYAINLGFFEGNLGEVFALFPEEIEWQSISDNFTQFFSNAINRAYTDKIKDLYFDGEAAILLDYPENKSINFYPPLYTEEGSPMKSSKRLINVDELFDFRQNIL